MYPGLLEAAAASSGVQHSRYRSHSKYISLTPTKDQEGTTRDPAPPPFNTRLPPLNPHQIPGQNTSQTRRTSVPPAQHTATYVVRPTRPDTDWRYHGRDPSFPSRRCAPRRPVRTDSVARLRCPGGAVGWLWGPRWVRAGHEMLLEAVRSVGELGESGCSRHRRAMPTRDGEERSRRSTTQAPEHEHHNIQGRTQASTWHANHQFHHTLYRPKTILCHVQLSLRLAIP